MPDRGPSPLTRLTLVNSAIVGTATLITAVAGLVIEDLLPTTGPHWGWVTLRVLVLAALLVGLYALMSHRTGLHRTTGTVFHVQVLDESMADLRADARTEASRQRMAVRSIIRWVDVGHRTDPTTGVIDAIDLVAEVADRLQAQINADTPETGYTLAPVMPWPMALALGTELPLPDRLTVLELQGSPDLPTTLVELTGSRSTARAGALPRLPLALGAESGSGRFGVFLALTAASRDVPPGQWRTLGVSDGLRLQRAIDLPDERVVLTARELTELAEAMAADLVELRRAEPDREMVVIATIPKTVAVLLGWHIAQAQCRFFRNTHLMHYDRPSMTMLPMRVRESQPAHAPAVVHA